MTPALCLFVKIHFNLRLKFHQFRGFFAFYLVAVEFRHTSFSISIHPSHTSAGEEVVFPDEKPRQKATPSKS